LTLEAPSPAISEAALEAELTHLLGLTPAARHEQLVLWQQRSPSQFTVLHRRLQHLESLGLLAERTVDDLGPSAAVGDYRLEGRIGGGGGGVVFAATHVPSGRAVALKLLRTAEISLEVERVRFQRETRAIARMAHPGICPLYDAGLLDGMPFLAMPRLNACSLADHVARSRTRSTGPTTAGVDLRGEHGRARVASILLLVERIADALQHAHERGVVHRDVKPGNVLIDDRGEPILIDFGLVLGDDDARARVTATREIVGTPLYLAPETVAGRAGAPDPRLDVYGLGAVLYECLTLRPPFAEGSRASLYRAIVEQDPPDPRRHNRFVPRDLVTVLRTAMAKGPAMRYRSAQTFAEDVRCVRTGRPIAARRPSWPTRVWRWSQRHPAAAVLLAALAITQAAIGIHTWRARADARVAAEQAAVEGVHVAWAHLLASAAQVGDANARARELLPPWPEKAPHLAAWLRDRGEPLAARLPDVRRALSRVTEAETVGSDAHPTRDLEPEDVRLPRVRYLGRELRAVAAELEHFATSDEGALAQVRQRLAWARVVEQRSIGDFAAAWQEARASIRASSRYGGLDLPPQVGLVPLGKDPATGLWEFADLASGADGSAASLPRRDAAGRLLLDPAMGLVFVLLPGGAFVNGAQGADPHADNYDPEAFPWEAPPHVVRLDPFFIAKYEMTQAQWRRLHLRDPSYWRERTPRRDGRGHSLLQPVEQVTWYEATDVLARLGCDLPTSAQWEYAARGGTGAPRYTDGDAESLESFENVADQWSVAPPEPWALPFHDGFVGTSPVASFRPNPYGLHDVYGNVAEWCRDAYPEAADSLPFYTVTIARDGDGLRLPPSMSPRRVLRGGNAGTPRGLRSASWATVLATTSGPNGVRPVRAVRGWRRD